MEENANLKTVIAETASSVTGAVELRAETLRQVMADNEEAETRITVLQEEVQGAESRVQAAADELSRYKEMAALALRQRDADLLRERAEAGAGREENARLGGQLQQAAERKPAARAPPPPAPSSLLRCPTGARSETVERASAPQAGVRKGGRAR